MYQNKLHLPAFTILELMVGMTLTSILVVASMYAFQLIQRQYVLQTQMQNELDSRIDWKTRLLLDVENLTTISRKDKNLWLTQEKHEIKYQFESNFIVRTNKLSKIAPDTFWVTAKIIEANFNQQPTSEGWIDNCQFEIDLFGETEHWQFQKKYTAQEKYLLTQNANHYEY